MLILIKREQEALAAFFEWAEIGPTSPSGWTAIWCENLPDGLTLVADRIVCLDDDVIDVTMEGESLQLQPGSSDPAEVADILARALEMPENARDIQSALVNSSDVDEISERLGTLGHLPEMQPGDPIQLVILHRGDRASVRMAIRIAGPARLTSLDPDWSLISEIPEDVGGSFALVTANTDSRRAVSLVLWRRNEGSGVAVFDRESAFYATEWNSGWRHVEPAAARAESIQALADKLGPQVNVRRLSKLHVPNASSGDPLAEMLRILGLPEAALDHLDGRSTAGEWVTKSSGLRAWWEAVRIGSNPELPRWFLVTWAVLMMIGAVVCLLMTVLTVSVLITSGAFLGIGVEEGDGWFALMFAALTLVLGWLTLRRIRELRQP